MYNYLTAAPAGIPDLKAVLNLHVATAVVYSNELAATQNVPTINGEVLFPDAIESCDSIVIGFANTLFVVFMKELTVTVNGSVVTVSNAGSSATVVSADNLASNGVAHVIDQVRLSLVAVSQ